jgi:predicted MPP superfamily phosphohydrolase
MAPKRASEAAANPAQSHVRVELKRRFDLKVWAGAVAFLQVFLFFSHWFIYHTLISFWPTFLPLSPNVASYLWAILFLLSISFVVAALLSFRFANGLVALVYTIAATWLGFLNFLFCGACLCWIVALVAQLISTDAATAARPVIGSAVFGLALLTGIYGLINARFIRERRVTVTLPNLPETWRGRTALLITDLHLGNVNAAAFSRRIAAIAERLNPSVILFSGDVYDGSKADPAHLAGPLFKLAPPFGMYFCGGNHEDFGNPAEYSATLTQGGIRVLHNERVIVDGLQLIGISYADSTYPAHLHSYLDSLQLASGPASILLNHVPHRLPIVERTGVSLQLSGHTHGGQIFPFTLITRWIYGQFTYGLQRFGDLQVFTSSGAGTWGPPMRVGTHPEVVLITFA